MAQVIRKLQGGGNVSKKYGRIIVNGNIINDAVDEDFISSKFGDDKVGSAIAEQLRRGEDVRFSNGVNTPSSVNVTIDGLKLNPPSRFGGGRQREIRSLIDNYASYTYSKDPDPVDTYDFSSDLNLDYDASNIDAFSRTPAYTKALDRIKEYLRISKEGLHNGNYKWHSNSNFAGGLNPDGEDVRNYISHNYDRFQQLLDSGLEVFDDEDLAMLKSIGININDSTKFEPMGKKKSNPNGNDGGYVAVTPGQHEKSLGLDISNKTISSMGLIKNDDGSYTISSEWLKDHPDFNRAHITDAWLLGRSEFEPLKGGFFYDGKYYPKEIAEDPDSVFHKNIIPFYKPANIAGTQNTLGIDRWGNAYNPFIKYDESQGYIPFMYDVLKEYTNPWVASSPSGIEGIYNYSVYDDKTSRDIWGIPNSVTSYVYNPNTGEYDISNDYLEGYSNINSIKWSEQYPGYYEIPLTDKTNGTNSVIYVSADNPNEMYYSREGFSAPVELSEEEIKQIFGNYIDKPYNLPTGTIGRKMDEDLYDFQRGAFGRFFTTKGNRRKLGFHKSGGYVTSEVKQESKQLDSKSSSIGDSSKAAKRIENSEGFKFEELTTADKIQLVGVAADLTGFLSSIVGGGNVVSGASGLAGSLSNFAADVTRDGVDVKDIGNLLLDAGIDAASVIPGFGWAASSWGVARTIKRAYNALKPILLTAGLGQGVAALNNIKNGSTDINDFRMLSNSLSSLVGVGRLKNERKVSRFIPEKAGEIDIKSMRNKYIDDFISKSGNSSATYHNNVRNKWFDESTGRVKSGVDPETGKSYYDLAYEGLKGKKKDVLGTDDDFSFNEESIKAKAKTALENAKTKAGNLFDRINVFSDKFKYDDSNRVLITKNNGDITTANESEIQDMIDEYPSVMKRLAKESSKIREKIMSVDPDFLKKSGGVIKAQHGLSFGNNKGLRLDITKPVLTGIRYGNALKNANNQEDLAIKAANDSKYNIVAPKVETPRLSTAQVQHAENNAINEIRNTNLPIVNDAKLSSANAHIKSSNIADIRQRAGAEYSKIYDQFEQNRIQNNYINSQNQASVTNKLNEMDAKIKSSKSTIAKEYLGVKNNLFNSLMEQMEGNYENLNKLRIKSDIERQRQTYENEYLKSYNDLERKLKDYMSANGITNAQLATDPYYNNVYIPSAQALKQNYNNQIASAGLTWRNPISGFGIYSNPVLMDLPVSSNNTGNVYVRRKGGSIRPYNEEALLESLKSRHKHLKDVDDRVLKVLLNLFK